MRQWPNFFPLASGTINNIFPGNTSRETLSAYITWNYEVEACTTADKKASCLSNFKVGWQNPLVMEKNLFILSNKHFITKLIAYHYKAQWKNIIFWCRKIMNLRTSYGFSSQSECPGSHLLCTISFGQQQRESYHFALDAGKSKHMVPVCTTLVWKRHSSHGSLQNYSLLTPFLDYLAHCLAALSWSFSFFPHVFPKQGGPRGPMNSWTQPKMGQKVVAEDMVREISNLTNTTTFINKEFHKHLGHNYKMLQEVRFLKSVGKSWVYQSC